MPYTIYALMDPCTGEVCYVGVTTVPLPDRLSAHIKEARSGEASRLKNKWIRRVLSRGLKPSIVCLESGIARSDAAQAEEGWITYFRDKGYELTNTGPAGAGICKGRRHLDYIANDTESEIIALWDTIEKAKAGYIRMGVLGRHHYNLWIRRLQENIESLDDDNPTREAAEITFNDLIVKLTAERDEKYPPCDIDSIAAS